MRIEGRGDYIDVDVELSSKGLRTGRQIVVAEQQVGFGRKGWAGRKSRNLFKCDVVCGFTPC